MKEKYMKDFNGEKIFSLEYDKETLKDMVLDKDKEIERLNNEIKILKNNKDGASGEAKWWEEKYAKEKRENNRLNNIITELEKWFKENDKQLCIRKLKELKGSDKE